MKYYIIAGVQFCFGLGGALAIVFLLSGCADMKKEDKDTITDILAIPFRIIGM